MTRQYQKGERVKPIPPKVQKHMTFFTTKSKFGTQANHRKLIRTRAKLPDGSVVEGRQGQQVIDQRRRQRDLLRKSESLLK